MAQPDNQKLLSAAEASKALVRSARKAALATVDKASGVPYASLVTVATEPDGTPLLLISRLALHTQNLLADSRASLMFDGSGPDGDPLAGGRVTLIGSFSRTEPATARRRFLARHPGAETYVDFPDFGFFSMRVERAHYIGGFGRIVDLTGADLVVPLTGADSLVAAEEEIIIHMNEDHADAVALYATKLLGGASAQWRLVGVDPEGSDLMADGATLRLPFSTRVLTPDAARQEFVRMAREARA